MNFIVDRQPFVNMFKLTSDERSKNQWLYDTLFVRIEAEHDQIKLIGKQVEATFAAAVYRIPLAHYLVPLDLQCIVCPP